MPTSPRHYQRDRAKKAIGSESIFDRPKIMVKSKEIDETRIERYKEWVTMFRQNPNLLIEMYFGIKLYTYQKLMIFALQKSDLAYFVASRASAKSFIIAIWACCLAVLYPNIRVIICAKTLKQGGIIIEKISSLRENYPNVEREISVLVRNANTNEVQFHNGSIVKVVPSSDNARGNRAGYEYALLVGNRKVINLGN